MFHGGNIIMMPTAIYSNFHFSQGGQMMIDDKTRLFLSDKLHLSPIQLSRLEKNSDLLSKTLGLLELFKQSPDQKETRLYVQKQLKNIRKNLDRQNNLDLSLLKKARSEYYTFQRAIK